MGIQLAQAGARSDKLYEKEVSFITDKLCKKNLLNLELALDYGG